MKVKVTTIVFLLFSVLMLNSCAGAGDWKYDDLPKDYSIWRTNGRSITLNQDVDATSAYRIVGPYVSEIAYNDSYIFAKQVSVPEDVKEKIDTSNPKYYILIVESDKLFGPYTKEEFIDKCDELNIENEIDWIVTTKLKSKQKNK